MPGGAGGIVMADASLRSSQVVRSSTRDAANCRAASLSTSTRLPLIPSYLQLNLTGFRRCVANTPFGQSSKKCTCKCSAVFKKSPSRPVRFGASLRLCRIPVLKISMQLIVLSCIFIANPRGAADGWRLKFGYVKYGLIRLNFQWFVRRGQWYVRRGIRPEVQHYCGAEQMGHNQPSWSKSLARFRVHVSHCQLVPDLYYFYSDQRKSLYLKLNLATISN